MRKKIILITISLIALLLFFATYIIIEKFEVMKTKDIIGQIMVTMSWTLEEKNWKEYDFIKETKQRFPHIEMKDNKIVDYWNNEIKVQIKEEIDRFNVKIISSGKDGVFGTKDDICREFFVQPKTKENPEDEGPFTKRR